jgi:hypothetical protein
MRGGSQSLLVRDGGGNAYIAKCVGNPQGTRTLINEWMVSRLLKYLRVSTPEVEALGIERGIPGDNLLEFHMGNRKVPIVPGVHLGSRCPVDPEQKAIFDFLPRRLMHKVVNLPDLLLAFVFDKWVNQTDSRQAIFIRERSAERAAKYRLYLIDHGQSFGGSRWEFCDGALNGLYRDRSIYESPTAEFDCHRAVDRINELPEMSMFSIEKEIPEEWLQPGDRQEMRRLLELLSGRRTKLHDTIDRALRQVQEAGIAMPKTADGRLLLGALLVLACLPGPPASSKSSGIALTWNREELPCASPLTCCIPLLYRLRFSQPVAWSSSPKSSRVAFTPELGRKSMQRRHKPTAKPMPLRWCRQTKSGIFSPSTSVNLM